MLDKQISDYFKRRKTEKPLIVKEAEEEIGDPPSEWIEEAKKLFSKSTGVQCPYCKKSITPFKKPLGAQKLYNICWLTLATISVIGSFLFYRYFFQFLAVALFFGIKWIVDQKSTTTQILIYKALKDEEIDIRSGHLHNTPTHL
ncbi:MAG: hypothetical protein COT00_02950 [Candidatus Omnitrophica bacterium CG07_land_8_20_14_0_80_50_8]|nr:MAG: hypothetical protein COT00_02950 [Candidatus Omnitrophica bacterium CG07_land_8_20_14_0_80_50_8]